MNSNSMHEGTAWKLPVIPVGKNDDLALLNFRSRRKRYFDRSLPVAIKESEGETDCQIYPTTEKG